jgi:hypothetical protein
MNQQISRNSHDWRYKSTPHIDIRFKILGVDTTHGTTGEGRPFDKYSPTRKLLQLFGGETPGCRTAFITFWLDLAVSGSALPRFSIISESASLPNTVLSVACLEGGEDCRGHLMIRVLVAESMSFHNSWITAVQLRELSVMSIHRYQLLKSTDFKVRWYEVIIQAFLKHSVIDWPPQFIMRMNMVWDETGMQSVM